MALLSLSNLEKSFGPRAVLKGLSLSLERGDRLGLIGRNGCGKSTLLNVITGREEPDRGQVHIARDLRLAWLDQAPELNPQFTVWEEARTALAELEELEKRLEDWRHKIADAKDHVLNGAEHDAYARDEAQFADRSTVTDANAGSRARSKNWDSTASYFRGPAASSPAANARALPSQNFSSRRSIC